MSKRRSSTKKQPETSKRKKWGSARTPLVTPPTTQATVRGMYLSGAKQRAISRELGLDRETVARIVSNDETRHLVQGYRSAVLKIVPSALIGLRELVSRLSERAIVETLYGARVLIERHEVAEVESDDDERDFSYPKVEFFSKFGRWPLEKELKAFEKTLDIKPLVKGELSE